jgi:predicted O-methyltransferase YrrM
MPAPNKQAQTDWDNRAEVDATLYASYIRYPATLGMAFDVVLVDGRARCFCMPEGFRLLRPGGILILHDAQRTEYHTAAAALGKPVFLTPWKQGQVCLVRKDDAR